MQNEVTPTWRLLAVARCVPDDGVQPRPHWWDSGEPACVDNCPLHDGKRCKLTGHRPRGLCEPVVEQMAMMLDELTKEE